MNDGTVFEVHVTSKVHPVMKVEKKFIEVKEKVSGETLLSGFYVDMVQHIGSLLQNVVNQWFKELAS
jgi:hypothetical protein